MIIRSCTRPDYDGFAEAVHRTPIVLENYILPSDANAEYSRITSVLLPHLAVEYDITR